MSSEEYVVVTGASTGIGAASAHELARLGFHVLAGVRRDRDADALRAPGVEPVILDITESRHIADLAARVSAQAGALRALVNNAAVSVNAPVETLPLAEWRRLFEVNLFGHVAVTQALLPALLRHAGRVVNVSSVGGKVAMATFGPYAGTKFALEAVSDALRREVAPLGVRVVVVEPGGIRTEMADRGIATTSRLAEAMTPQQKARYGALVQAVVSLTAAGTAGGRSPEDAARVIAKAVTASRPKTRYTIGRDAALLTRLARILPDRMLDRVAAAALRGHWVTSTRTQVGTAEPGS
ncbi:SDR family oxidoreductase [Streptosporangium sp. NPDC051023]|uniref:SDR family oxidoreductase n=1 Tax=Streptosporangium sp. NPDC051023 TaxID=3155410 RepID=UPI0034501626